MNRIIVVLYDGEVLVCLNKLDDYRYVSQVLDDYAKHYAFDRSKLSGFITELIDYPPRDK